VLQLEITEIIFTCQTRGKTRQNASQDLRLAAHMEGPLENSLSDNIVGNDFDSFPVLGYVVDRPLDPDKLKSALECVIRHFPVLSARMCRNGKELKIPTEEGDLVSWTFVDHGKPMATAFAPLPQTDVISINRLDVRERAEFYIPLKSTTVRRPHVADEHSPLLEVRVQRFTDKTVIGLSWNHLLTDGSGMAIVLQSWAKVLGGDSSLPEVASNDDPFRGSYKPNPTLPPGTVHLGFWKKVQVAYSIISDLLWYGPLEPHTIFIPDSVLREWKSASDGVSTNDLLTAWLVKAWASTIKGTLSVYTVMDLRKHLPEIVPPTYLRNATAPRTSPHTLKPEDVNKMSHIELAKIIRSFVKYFSPEVELNYQSYEFKMGVQLAPEANRACALSSWSAFNLPKLDFGGKTESFEAFIRMGWLVVDSGIIWLEEGGARINFWMHKRKWNQGVWRTIYQFE
jgi:hypothetical protein